MIILLVLIFSFENLLKPDQTLENYNFLRSPGFSNMTPLDIEKKRRVLRTTLKNTRQHGESIGDTRLKHSRLHLTASLKTQNLRLWWSLVLDFFRTFPQIVHANRNFIKRSNFHLNTISWHIQKFPKNSMFNRNCYPWSQVNVKIGICARRATKPKENLKHTCFKSLSAA